MLRAFVLGVGWFFISAGLLCMLGLLIGVVRFELWEDRLRKYLETPRYCAHCGKYGNCVPHCQDRVDRAQLKLGEKW